MFIAAVVVCATLFAGVTVQAGNIEECDSFGCLTSTPSYSRVTHHGHSRYGTTHSRSHTINNFSHHNHQHNYGVSNFNRNANNFGHFSLGGLFVTDGYNGYNGVSGFSHSRSIHNNSRGTVLIRLGGQYVLGSVFEHRVVNFIDELSGRIRTITLVRTRVGSLDFWVQNTTLFHNFNGFNRTVYVPFNNQNFLFSVNGNFFRRTNSNFGY